MLLARGSPDAQSAVLHELLDLHLKHPAGSHLLCQPSVLNENSVCSNASHRGLVARRTKAVTGDALWMANCSSCCAISGNDSILLDDDVAEFSSQRNSHLYDAVSLV